VAKEPDRVAVPLVMLPGNMEVLLNNRIDVSGVSLVPHDGTVVSGEAVVLMFHFRDEERELAIQAGMKFGKVGEDGKAE